MNFTTHTHGYMARAKETTGKTILRGNVLGGGGGGGGWGGGGRGPMEGWQDNVWTTQAPDSYFRGLGLRIRVRVWVRVRVGVRVWVRVRVRVRVRVSVVLWSG